MEYFDSAKTSLDVENTIVRVMEEEAYVFKSLTDAHKFREAGEAIYKVEITVTQVYPPL